MYCIIETDRQTDKQPDSQSEKDRQVDRLTDRQTNRKQETEKETERQLGHAGNNTIVGGYLRKLSEHIVIVIAECVGYKYKYKYIFWQLCLR